MKRRAGAGVGGGREWTSTVQVTAGEPVADWPPDKNSGMAQACVPPVLSCHRSFKQVASRYHDYRPGFFRPGVPLPPFGSILRAAGDLQGEPS